MMIMMIMTPKQEKKEERKIKERKKEEKEATGEGKSGENITVEEIRSKSQKIITSPSSRKIRYNEKEW